MRQPAGHPIRRRSLPSLRTRAALAAAGALVVLGAAAAGAAAAPPTATFAKTSDWGSGFVAHYVIRNPGPSAVTDWRLELDLPAGVAVTGAWSGRYAATGGHGVITPEDWTRTIPAGGSVDVGFQGTSLGAWSAPANCLLNGQACAGGTTPPPPPPDTTAPTTPANLAATNVTQTGLTLSWSAASDTVGVTGYAVYRGATKVASPTATTTAITGLSAGTAYAFTVRALDAAGNASGASAPLAVTTASPPPPPPPATGGLTATFAKTDDWGTGFVASYTIRNATSAAVSTWKLEFDLPANVHLTSAWSGKLATSANHNTLTPEDWTRTVPAGGSVTVGFQGDHAGAFSAPTGCLLNGADCGSGGGTTTPPADPNPPTDPPPPAGTPITPAFAPYVDMTLWPQFPMGEAARTAGLRKVTLGFIVSGAACKASWGTYYGLADPYITQPLADLRAAGGDAIVSFGGAVNQELAETCTTVDALAAQYQSVIDAYGIRDLDFDVEGAGQGNTAANTRRAQALAKVQAAGAAAGRPVHVSYTLPVMPTGLSHDGLTVLRSAIAGGVDVSVVNVMAMDYFDPSLGDPTGRMGDFAIQAATSTHDQLATLYPGRTDAALWRMVGVTPMLGINDNPREVFTTADAAKLATFANARHLGRLAMWDTNRDGPCPGPTTQTQLTCSGVSDRQWAFARAFGAFTG
jgi:cellulose binding protein with CBM2 domain/fibronectin type III domain protein